MTFGIENCENVFKALAMAVGDPVTTVPIDREANVWGSAGTRRNRGYGTKNWRGMGRSLERIPELLRPRGKTMNGSVARI